MISVLLTAAVATWASEVLRMIVTVKATWMSTTWALALKANVMKVKGGGEGESEKFQ